MEETKRKNLKLVEHKDKISGILIQIFAITLGGIMASLALGAIIIPNDMLDGGVTGIAIILNDLFKSDSLPMWIALLNIPFVIFAYLILSKKKAYLSIYGIAVFAIGSGVTHHMEPWIKDDKLLALLFGGVLMGAAIGIVIKFGGAVLDGAEIVSVYVDKVTSLNTDTVLFGINIFVFGFSSFVFGLESGLYSIVMFYVAAFVIAKVNSINFKAHDTIEVRINTSKVREINNYIYSVDYQSEIQKVIGGYHFKLYNDGETELADERLIVSTNVARTDVDNLVKNIKEIDAGAYITFKKITELSALESNNKH